MTISVSLRNISSSGNTRDTPPPVIFRLRAPRRALATLPFVRVEFRSGYGASPFGRDLNSTRGEMMKPFFRAPALRAGLTAGIASGGVGLFSVYGRSI